MKRANPRSGVNATEDIIDDGLAPTSLVRGGRTKRTRPISVDSGSDSDEDNYIDRITKARARVAAVTESSIMVASSRQASKDSPFVQQAIELVNSSHTVKEQVANLQKKLDTEVAARLKAEQGERTATEGFAASAVEIKILRSKGIELQHKLDKMNRDGGLEKEALAKAIRRQSLTVDIVNRIREEREELRQELAKVKETLKDEKGMSAGLQAELDEEERNLFNEKEDHAKTASQLVKWKATFAALQGLQ